MSMYADAKLQKIVEKEKRREATADGADNYNTSTQKPSPRRKYPRILLIPYYIQAMIKATFTPQSHTYNLAIPPGYIGKKIEILLYALDEVAEEKNTTAKKSLVDFGGILSEQDYQALKTHTEQARTEWNRDT